MHQVDSRKKKKGETKKEKRIKKYKVFQLKIKPFKIFGDVAGTL